MQCTPNKPRIVAPENRMPTPQVIDKFKSELNCAICLCLANDPQVTPCDHLFCNDCMMEYLKRNKSASCPICKRHIFKRELRKSRTLANLIKTIIDARTPTPTKQSLLQNEEKQVVPKRNPKHRGVKRKLRELMGNDTEEQNLEDDKTKNKFTTEGKRKKTEELNPKGEHVVLVHCSQDPENDLLEPQVFQFPAIIDNNLLHPTRSGARVNHRFTRSKSTEASTPQSSPKVADNPQAPNSHPQRLRRSKSNVNQEKPAKSFSNGVITTSALNTQEITMVKQFCRNHGFKYCATIRNDLTHIVTKALTDEKHRRTAKCFYAIANSLLIVDYGWISHSLAQEFPIEMDNFLINKPSELMKTLFNDINFYFIGAFGINGVPNKEVLHAIVGAAGGNVIAKEKLKVLKENFTKYRFIVGEANAELEALLSFAEGAGAFLNHQWILDSLEAGKKLELRLYNKY